MTQRISLDHIEMEYLLTGEDHSETILFVHGLGADLSQFTYQQAYFSTYFRVLSVNLRGHGLTTVHQNGNHEFGLDNLAADIVELLDRLSIAKVHFVGNSMGGNVGLEMMKSYPNRLKSISTFGTTASLHTSNFTFAILKLMHKIISPNMRGALSKVAGQNPTSKMKIEEMMTQVDRSTILGLIPELANFDYLDVIRESKLPYLLIKGEKDSDINRVLDSTIATLESRGNFEMITMKGAGHFANLDQPDLFNEILEKFISSQMES